ncbi:MAG: hypothetical protein IKI22_05345 [Neisseriaceae bacterium]|nr:hypothetical protein [Neisseriaceae bacterium]
MKKLFLYLSICYTVLSTNVCAEQILYNPNNPEYHNQRYGFSITLPAGNSWDIVESESGDGITVQEDDDILALIYGTKAYMVLEKDFDAALAEQKQQFAQISEEKVDKNKVFALKGKDKQENLLYIKCFYNKEQAVILHLTVNKKANPAQLIFDTFIKTTEKSFKVR